MQTILFVGIPGAGKSSFYKERFYTTHIRISRDMVRTATRESILINACLIAKQPFVVDNTNISEAERAGYIAAAKAAGFRVAGYYFKTSVADAISRNEKRVGREKIPKVGIFTKQKKLQPPRLEEGFDELFQVEISPMNQFIVHPMNEPEAGGVNLPSKLQALCQRHR